MSAAGLLGQSNGNVPDCPLTDYVGVEVKKGDALAELYSEELYLAEEELIQALKYQKQRPQDERNIDLVAVAREKLRPLGLTKEQIEKLEKQDKPTGRVTLYVPASGVITEKHAVEGDRVRTGARLLTIADPTRLSIKLDASVLDMRWVRLGQPVTLATASHPGATFGGRIAFIGPIVDPKTRTVHLRVDFLSPDRKLKPGMFVRGDVHVAETEHTKG